MVVIRRIRDQAVEHNWFAVCVDLAIVVVGVFLGLQASDWNTARIEKGEAREYRSEIIASLEANEADMLARAAYYEQVHAHALAALNILSHAKSRPGEQFLVDAYLATSTNRRPLERSAYDEMIASGVGRDEIGLATRAQMAAYYAQIPQFNENVLSIAPYKEQLRRTMIYSVQQRIAKSCADDVRTLPSGVQIVSMPGSCEVRLDPETVTTAINQLKSNHDLSLELTLQLADLDNKLGLFRRYATLAHELRVNLQSGGVA